jgi:hypothetical protein
MCAASVSVQADEVTDQSNTLSLPRPAWKLVAQGAVGAGQLLVPVSDTPRDLKTLIALPPEAAAPFTISLKDLPGRAALIDFFAGQGAAGMTESFGAKLLAIKEIK